MQFDQLKRRGFITLLGGATATWPLAARAQQSRRVRRIGIVMPFATGDSEGEARIRAFKQELAKLGWTDGGNIQFDERWPADNMDLVRSHAASLVASDPDIIVAAGGRIVLVLMRLTRSIPMVLPGASDPVGVGWAQSLARPGGNVTGFTQFEFGLSAKCLELLREIAPQVTRVGIVREVEGQVGVAQWAVIAAAASPLGVELSPINVRADGETERAVVEFARDSNDGLIVVVSSIATIQRDLLVKLAARHRLPAVCPYRFFVDAGGLIHTGRTCSMAIAARPPTSIASSRARSQPTCRCRRQPSMNWRSTSRPRRRSASKFPTSCSRLPTR
jgi:putative ABC transport system substrate-binding protein